ncbi:adenine nucleotide alpha hydrolases-like protein [Mytilinidion resinicola]|uniref:FAD synthase n=1 Tax=Mytilinidion resinicola TaxID=574789 RepID=A0A6A6YIH2_9PEZI|nr:adenine nucleotide alpha hydrolases-like protein [Mytilinidion resinicola]KAF2808323.1 adenine nucleotide alpha hydrolases-like protein [Mytilinidion resinicola]
MPAPLLGESESCNAAPQPVSPLVADTPPPLPDVCAKIYNRINAFLEEETDSQRLQGLQKQTRISLDVISEALDRYSLSELSLSYNGGKDCLVLLILYLYGLHAKGLTRPTVDNVNSNHHEPIQCVYIQSQHPFQEVEDFVASSVSIYSLSLDHYAKPMKAAFADYLHDKPSVKAIFVGTRRTDPHGADLTHFDPTDHGWPKFMRIHPVIDWHYVEIWTFIRHLQIPYCVLYDHGYTSLGGTTDTLPNPALLRDATLAQNGNQNGAGTAKYRPAYELVEDEEERLGRD